MSVCLFVCEQLSDKVLYITLMHEQIKKEGKKITTKTFGASKWNELTQCVTAGWLTEKNCLGPFDLSPCFKNETV